jgi:hypothetical protein
MGEENVVYKVEEYLPSKCKALSSNQTPVSPKKMLYKYTMEHYSVTKKEAVLSFATT